MPASVTRGGVGTGDPGQGGEGVRNNRQRLARRLLAAFAADESGATAIEYGMLALIMALGIISSISAFPTTLNGILSNVTTNLN
jgi:pilus assembly protein Flp/PilA